MRISRISSATNVTNRIYTLDNDRIINSWFAGQVDWLQVFPWIFACQLRQVLVTFISRGNFIVGRNVILKEAWNVCLWFGGKETSSEAAGTQGAEHLYVRRKTLVGQPLVNTNWSVLN